MRRTLVVRVKVGDLRRCLVAAGGSLAREAPGRVGSALSKPGWAGTHNPAQADRDTTVRANLLEYLEGLIRDSDS